MGSKLRTHRLHQRKDPALEKRIERLAGRYFRAKMRGEKAHSLAERYKYELSSACFRYFFVTGKGLEGATTDEVFNTVLLDAMRRYDPNKPNASLVHYIARAYPNRIKDAVEKEEKEQEREGEKLDPYEAGEDRARSLMDDDDAYDEADYEVEDEAETEEQIDQDESRNAEPRVRDLYYELLTLLLGFLDHVEDGKHQEISKVYLRMVFTERITFAIRSQPRFIGCEPIVRHERDTFRAMELGFLDSFFVRSIVFNTACTVLRIYEETMLDEYREAIEKLCQRIIDYEAGNRATIPRMSWLATEDYRRYLRERYDIEQKNLSVIVSQQRARFDRFEDELFDRA